MRRLTLYQTKFTHQTMPEIAGVAVEPETIKKLQEVFREIDTDKSGTVSFAEFSQACYNLSIEVGVEEVKEFKKSDISGSGELTFDEFCVFYICRLKSAFDCIDVDKNGEVGAVELKNAFEGLGFHSTLREIRTLLQRVDKDKNEAVNLAEFCNFFCFLPSPDIRSIVQQWAAGLAIDTGSDIAPQHIPPASLTIWRAIFAGGIAGVVSRTATAPLEKIKILAQTSNSGKIPVLQSLKNIWKAERVRGLLAGNGANCFRVFPFSGLVCLAYANLAKQFPLDDSSSPYNPVWRMAAGAFAGMFATILTHPIDVVRAKLTVQSHQSQVYRGLFHGLKEIAIRERMPGLYRGIGPTLLAIAPFMAVQQSCYDVLKQQAINHNLEPSAPLFFACGSVAGGVAQTVVYPLDVIRRRMQIQKTNEYKKFSVLIRTLTFQELFYGLSATYLKVMPAAAISLLVRDAILGRLNS